jgi:hypothetical protein
MVAWEYLGSHSSVGQSPYTLPERLLQRLILSGRRETTNDSQMQRRV